MMMRRRRRDWRIVAGAVLVALCPVFLMAAPVYLRVVNSRSGLGAPPDKISVDGQPVEFHVERQSLVALDIPEGKHTIEVEADGFALMRVDVTVGADPVPIMEVELDPITAPDEAPVPEDAALLVGTVSDADTAEAISGARVQLVDSALSAVTTGSGEFRFEVKTGAARSQSMPAVSMEVEAEGYDTVRLSNIALDRGGRARVPVRLSTSTSATAELIEIDAESRPGGRYATDWVFDVTIH